MTRGAGHRDCDEVTDKGAGLDIKGWGFEIGAELRERGRGSGKGVGNGGSGDGLCMRGRG